MANQVFGYQTGLTALAGGAVAGATQLLAGSNRVTVCATAADSTLLPLAIPSQMVLLVNDGVASCRTFPTQSNPATGVADTIAPHDSSVYGASADTAAAAVSTFVCVELGKWKQILDT